MLTVSAPGLIHGACLCGNGGSATCTFDRATLKSRFTRRIPKAIEPKPWFAIFLPNRVFLERITSEHSNVIWRFRGERAGFFGTQLLITPNERQCLRERSLDGKGS